MYLAAATSEHICDIMFLPRDCHDDLASMHRMFRREVERTNVPRDEGLEDGVKCPACLNARYDAVVLAMGLCGNTTQSYADEIGADGYAADASSAVELVKSLLTDRRAQGATN